MCQELKGKKSKQEFIMDNHVHILIKEGEEDLRVSMKRIEVSYVYWYNWKYDRVGHLFQDRYKSEVVENDRYLLTVLRYIHQNPLMANIVSDVKDYKWSSYSEYIHEAITIESKFILDIFDKDIKKAKLLFEEFHKIKDDIKCLDIEENRRIKDSEAMEIIKGICNVSHCMDIQGFSKIKRDSCFKIIKEKGLSTRQISRLTGVSRNIILKA